MIAAVQPAFPPGYAGEYIGYIARDVGIAFTVLEIAFVGLRYISQSMAHKRFGIDDFLILPGLILCLAINACCVASLKIAGVGYHIDVIAATNPEALIPWAKFLLAVPILYAPACAFPRFALLTLYLRIFTEKIHRIACYVTMALTIGLAVSCIITDLVQCVPLVSLWDKTINGECIDLALYFQWGTLPNSIVDLCILLLPIPVIWKLHVSRHVKVGVAATFLTGSVGLITSIIRSVTFFHSDIFDDGTWVSVTFYNWAIVEPGVYLIAACLPSYRPLVLWLLGRGDGQRSSERERNQYQATSWQTVVRNKGSDGMNTLLLKDGSARPIEIKISESRPPTSRTEVIQKDVGVGRV